MTAAATETVDFDAFEPAYRADPYPRYRRVREKGALVPILLGEARVTLATRYEECAAVLQGAEWGRGYEAGLNPFRPGVAADEVPGGSFLRMDPPDHTRLRGLVSKAFTPRMITGMAPGIEALADRLVDAARDADDVDIVEGLSRPVAVTVICGMLGIPEGDHGVFMGWAEAIARGTDPDHVLSPEEITRRVDAARELGGYLHALVTERRARPQDDLISMLIAVEERGDVLSGRELLEISGLLLLAGMDTTGNLISNGMLALLRHPDQLALLRERPELLPSAVEEMLRYDPPSQFVTRVALADTRIGEHAFRRGEGVVVLSASGHRDPLAYPDPDRFDITRYAARTPARRHLGFALGLHFCLGAPLARTQTQAAIGTLVRRAPALTLASDALAYRPNVALRGLASLPVSLQP